ncbi:MAG: GntR family transcriptional regulator [Pusillimonas sp.]
MSQLGMVTSNDEDFRATRIAAPLRQSVVENLRNAIAVGRFRAGERLVERDLCELTGVSRTLIREALRQLESEGLITVRPNRGPVVTILSAEQARNIYQVRRELEGLTAQLFVINASPGERSALKTAFKQLEATSASEDRRARLLAKTAFYDRLIAGAHNDVLGEMLTLMNSRVTLLRTTSMQYKDRWKASIKELKSLIQAIDDNDHSAARTAAEQHVFNAGQAALSVLSEENSK